MRDAAHDLHLDFETYCDLNLPDVGVVRYVAHPSFRVLAVAWAIDKGPSQGVAALDHDGLDSLPPALVRALACDDIQVHAWNAAFETMVLLRYRVALAHPLSCTMQRALAYGLPGALAAAGKAVGAAAVKDPAGARLMRRMTRPGANAVAWAEDDYKALLRYCVQDVEAEAAMDRRVPPLSTDETELAGIDTLMNSGGELAVDRSRVRRLRAVAEAAEQADAARATALTAGAVTSPGTQTARLLAWLKGCGYDLPDVARATVEEWLETYRDGLMPQEVEEVLRIRLRTARASTKKLARMLDMTRVDDPSLYGQFQFCGAGRTGRWSGRGVQVQNLPRVPKGFSPDAFAELARVAACSSTPGGPAGLGAVSAVPVLDGVAWSLRSCLRAADPRWRIMWGFDFAQIEARVLAWLAGQQDVLGVFRRGDEDVYVWAAAQFGSGDRQLGKVLILALGFGMGASKLQETAARSYGVQMTLQQAEQFKAGWRARNQEIVRFWYEIEDAARLAIVRRGATGGGVTTVPSAAIAFQCTARTLQMRLPSGRVLYYHTPAVGADGGITYWGADLGGGWAMQRTWGGKLAENATQAAARDVMAGAMLRIWRDLRAVPAMTVHDELVYALDQRDPLGLDGLAAQLERRCLENPDWAGGLPIAGEAKWMPRYGVAVTP